MKIPDKFTESKRNQNFRKTQPMCVVYKLIDLESMNTIIDERVFWPNNSMTCKAVIWISSPKGELYGWGVGITRGSGYHHESAAIMDAFQDMGIKFEAGEAFEGMGAGAQERAIQKIGEAMGYKNTLLVDINP
jgi:hypothetical protein